MLRDSQDEVTMRRVLRASSKSLSLTRSASWDSHYLCHFMSRASEHLRRTIFCTDTHCSKECTVMLEEMMPSWRCSWSTPMFQAWFPCWRNWFAI